MKKINLSDKRNGELIATYIIYDKKLFDMFIKKMKKNKKINLEVIDQWFMYLI